MKKILYPEWKEIFSLDKFNIYKVCAERFQPSAGILKIYKVSEYPEKKRFHVLHERYLYTMADFLPREYSSKAVLPAGAKGDKFKAGMGSLKKAKGGPTFAAKIKIAIDLTAGLTLLHSENIVHLSIQPIAIHIHPEADKPAEAALGHFEFGRIVDPAVKGIQETDMKRKYLAPELRNEVDLNHIQLPENPKPCDVYSLGICLNEFFGFNDEPKAVSTLKGKLSPEESVSHIIWKMTLPDPHLRISAEQACHDLKYVDIPAEQRVPQSSRRRGLSMVRYSPPTGNSPSSTLSSSPTDDD